MTFSVLSYAFLGGLLPSLVWLYFLLKEDARHPEPKSLIILTFIAGMVAVAIALPFEKYAHEHLASGAPVFIAWALIEELLKYALAAIVVLWRPAVDEAPDYVIYMLTVALGFAAAENMFFLFAPLMNGCVMSAFFTGDVRFLGSSLLHVVASSAIGFALAFSVKSSHAVRMAAACVGLILAVVLHAVFNTLIISTGTSSTLTAFLFVWVVAVIFLATFEVLKYFQYRNLPNPT